MPDVYEIKMQSLESSYATTSFKIASALMILLVLILTFIRLQPWFDWHETLLAGLTLDVYPKNALGILTLLRLVNVFYSLHWRVIRANLFSRTNAVGYFRKLLLSITYHQCLCFRLCAYFYALEALRICR